MPAASMRPGRRSPRGTHWPRRRHRPHADRAATRRPCRHRHHPLRCCTNYRSVSRFDGPSSCSNKLPAPIWPDLQSTRMKRLAPIVPALLLAACGGTTHTTAPTVTITQTGPAQPTITQTVGRTPPPAGPKTVIDAHGLSWKVIDNDGTYLVGVDIFAGKYRNAGGTMCYWARLRSLDPSDIIDSKKTSSPQEIGIRASDTAFLTQNCGTWQMTLF